MIAENALSLIFCFNRYKTNGSYDMYREVPALSVWPLPDSAIRSLYF